MWDLPGPGLEPVSPALAGGFLTTEPPGKPQKSFISRMWLAFLAYISVGQFWPTSRQHYKVSVAFDDCDTGNDY